MAIEEKVLNIIRSNIEKQFPLALHTDLRDKAGVDSFGTIMIVNGLEDAFGITIDEKDFLAVKTPADIACLLRTKYGVKGDG